MEKYTQFRDRGTGIAPFIPILTPTSTPRLLLHTTLFLLRAPFFLPIATSYLLFNLLTPFLLPHLLHRLLRWFLLMLAGILFVDIQVDGVKRGSLSSVPKSRIPHPNSIIASNFTSPVDALYLSAIFDPIFVRSFPGTKKVVKVSLLGAMLLALAPVELQPTEAERKGQMTTLSALLKEYPDRTIVVFPECSTTNGRGVLPLSPSLLTVPKTVDVFPLSIRYTLPDVTTPVPKAYVRFLWSLLSRPTTYARVRIADAVHTGSASGAKIGAAMAQESENESSSDDEGGPEVHKEERLTVEEKKLLDTVSDALARLGRNRRVGLTLKDKAGFAKAWYGK